jgi:predicted DNA-binding protein (UPF0251 family)
MQTMITTRKSVKLTPEELKALKKYRRSYSTTVECALTIGIDRMVLDRVLLVGSGSEDTIKKINETLQRLQ